MGDASTWKEKTAAVCFTLVGIAKALEAFGILDPGSSDIAQGLIEKVSGPEGQAVFVAIGAVLAALGIMDAKVEARQARMMATETRDIAKRNIGKQE